MFTVPASRVRLTAPSLVTTKSLTLMSWPAVIVSPPPASRSPPKIAEFTLMSTSACEVGAGARAQHARDAAGFGRADRQERRDRAAASRLARAADASACPRKSSVPLPETSMRPPSPPVGAAPRFDRAGKRRVPVGPDDNLTAVAPPGGIRLQAGAAIDRGLRPPCRCRPCPARRHRPAMVPPPATPLGIERRGRRQVHLPPRTWTDPPVAPWADSAPPTSTLPPSPSSRMRPPCSTAVSALIVPLMLIRLSSTFFALRAVISTAWPPDVSMRPVFVTRLVTGSPLRSRS